MPPEARKKPSYFPSYWLFNGDSQNGIQFKSIIEGSIYKPLNKKPYSKPYHNNVGFSIMTHINPFLYPKRTRGPFFMANLEIPENLVENSQVIESASGAEESFRKAQRCFSRPSRCECILAK